MAYIDFKQLVALEQGICFERSLSWKSSALSHPGKVRAVNEDAFYHSADQGLWAVADGMGGFARGDYASGVVVDAFAHFSPMKTLAENIRDLEMRLRRAHNLCRTSFPGEKVGSTVVALLSYGNYAVFLWAGDSRAYRLRGDQLKLMTVDHTVAQERYARGELTAHQAVTHPTSHILTRAIGVHQTLHLDLECEPVESGDRFLLCSDGVYNDVPRSDIHQLLQQGGAQDIVASLVAAAMDNGGHDNITAIVLDAE